MKKIGVIVLIFILTIGSSCRSSKQLLKTSRSSLEYKQETDSSFLANARKELRQIKLCTVK